MFNLIVTGNGTQWETEPYAFQAERFTEYSGAAGNGITAADAATLAQLEDTATLLVYETGARGPQTRTVRYGRISNIRRRGRNLTFEFEPDAEHGYLDQQEVFGRSEELGIEPFEQHRTHWAIKDGDLPPNLIETGRPEPQERTIAVIANEYGEALRSGLRTAAANLRRELEQVPASLDKAKRILAARRDRIVTPEILPILGIQPRTGEGRTALEAILAFDGTPGDSPLGWSYTIAWFLERYGSPTEAARRDEAVSQCETHLVELGPSDLNQPSPIEEIAYFLWRSSRSTLLVGKLHRVIAMQLHRLSVRQHSDGYWMTLTEDDQVTGVRATALATLAFQRLGDDRYHDAISRSVAWLLGQRDPESGAWPQHQGEEDLDLLTTVVTLEVIRRSDIAEGLDHVFSKAEAWLIDEQNEFGRWEADSFNPDFATSMVLDYLARPSEFLAQVDGFLLMARDFFRKAEELYLEGGANNRRLAAISTVHAVEMFLYGLFMEREDLGLSAFRENGAETLGPREALGQLQTALRRSGELAQNQKLSFRDQISSLIGHRDNIIHRAHEISDTELKRGLADARGFIDRYGKSLLEIDLLQ